MKKTETKKTKKSTKPTCIVDLTNVETLTDVFAAFGIAKQKAGIPITEDELGAIIDKTIDLTEQAISEKIALNTKKVKIEKDEKIIFDANGNYTIKKPNIFKRFWNWITKKNK